MTDALLQLRRTNSQAALPDPRLGALMHRAEAAVRRRDWPALHTAASELYATLGWPRWAGEVGQALMGMRRPVEALPYFERAIQLALEGPYPPGHDTLRRTIGYHWELHRISALALAGRWTEMSQRLRASYGLFPSWFGETFCREVPLCPAGQSLRGRRVLVLSGNDTFGDTLQWARYWDTITTQAARTTFVLPASLHALRPILAPLGSIVDEAAVAGIDADGWLPIEGGLALFAEHAPEADARRPLAVPYVRPQGPLRDELRLPGARMKVALSWAGNADDDFDRLRSVPRERWARIVATPGVDFVSVQVGRPPIAGTQDVAPRLRDFNDTAHILAQCDLVITVDTAMAHLAGAMGRPVWTLLRLGGDGRWGYEGARTGWYPSMKLFRQERYGDWSSVLAHVGHELQALVSGKGVS